MEHNHILADPDVLFEIDPETHEIVYPGEDDIILVKGDHNSERFTFEIPRTIESHDMSKCNKVQIHYINVGRTGETSPGVYDVPESDLLVDPEDDKIVLCSWLISDIATRYEGSLSFVVRYACVVDGVTEYAWNTAVYNGVIVLTSINNSDAIVERYPDVLEKWYRDLITAGEDGINVVEQAVAKGIEDIDSYVKEKKEEISGSDGKDGVDGQPGKDGVDGQPGKDGEDGEDGFSPTVSISEKVDGVTTVTITDANGAQSFEILDGEASAAGKPGKDGVSPTVAISKEGTVTTIKITDAEGEHTATINDGKDGAAGKSPTVDISKEGTVTTVTITDADGTAHTATINDGKDGSDGEDGAAGSADSVTTINDKTLKFFVGETSEYNELSDDEKTDLLAVITDDTSKEDLAGLKDGTVVANRATALSPFVSAFTIKNGVAQSTVNLPSGLYVLHDNYGYSYMVRLKGAGYFSSNPVFSDGASGTPIFERYHFYSSSDSPNYREVTLQRTTTTGSWEDFTSSTSPHTSREVTCIPIALMD